MKHGHGDLEASLVLLFPVLLAYEIGVLFAGNVAGADVVTRAMYVALGSRTLYLLVHAAIAVLFLLWARRGHRWGSLRMEVALPVVLEAAIYAFTLGAAIQLVLHHVLHLSLDGNSAISALGAGVHEELVFRLGILCAIVSMMREGRAAFPVALVISSLLFAGAHHLGPRGERAERERVHRERRAGAAFGAIFWYRSLAHAVYAHVLYDLVIAAS